MNAPNPESKAILTSYDAAFSELQGIVQDLDSEQISIDALASKVERASTLIVFCREKLRSTESEVTKIIEQIKPKIENND